MYSKRSGLIVGFHGCDISTRDSVVSSEKEKLKSSKNTWDWLGNGIYFWENNLERAYDFALQKGITNSAVVGAIIDLAYCLDLLETKNLKILKTAYEQLKLIREKEGKILPVNLPDKEGNDDLLNRKLDCAVINLIHQFNEENNHPEFDSVRGVFFEGEDLYPNAGFKEKNHIQIAVRNSNSIKGYFIPREADKKHLIP